MTGMKNIHNRFLLQWILRFSFVTFIGSAALVLLLRNMFTVDLGQSYKRAFFLLRNMESLLQPIIGFSLLFYMAVVSILAAAVLLYLTHRIAGPLLRLEHVARQIRSGDLTGGSPPRHGDQLEDLADATDRLLGTLRGQLLPLRSQLGDIGDALREIDNAAPEAYEEAARKALATIEDRLRVTRESLPG